MPPPNTPEEGLPGVGGSNQTQNLGAADLVPQELRDAEQQLSEIQIQAQLLQDLQIPRAGSTTSSEDTLEAMPTTPQPESSRKCPELDWAALEYVSTVSENLCCPICQLPMVSPVKTRCEHMFCRECFDIALEHNNICPLDRKTFQNEIERGRYPAKTAPRVIINLLDELKVKCPNPKCPRVEQRSMIKHHYEEDCVHTRVPCPDPTCEKTIRRIELQQDKCSHRIEPCELCGKLVDRADMDEHFETDCSMKLLTCEHCGKEVLRHRFVEVHMQECTELKRPCRFSSTGCPAMVRKADVADHERGCPFRAIIEMATNFRKHMDMMDQRLSNHEKSLQELSNASPSASAWWPRSPISSAAATPSRGMTRPSSREGFLSAGLAAASASSLDLSPLQPMAQHQQQQQPPMSRQEFRDRMADPRGVNTGMPPFSSYITPRSRHNSNSSCPDHDENHALFTRLLNGLSECERNTENFGRLLTEQGRHHDMVMMSELVPLKEQVNELRNSIAAMGVDLTIVMNRQKSMSRSAGANGGNNANANANSGSGGGGGGNGGNGGSPLSNAATTGANSDNSGGSLSPTNASAAYSDGRAHFQQQQQQYGSSGSRQAGGGYQGGGHQGAGYQGGYLGTGGYTPPRL